MSLYGIVPSMAYSYQMVVPSSGEAQLVLAQLQKTHLGYLQLGEGATKLATRRDLEVLITNHLTSVPHKEKFPCPKFLEILRRSIEERPDFNAVKAGQAFDALESYAVNLLSQPWRTEFRCIRLYSGFYTHQVEANLSGAREVLHQMGYVLAEGNEMRLNEPIDPDRVTDISLNCLIASVECKLMMKILEAVHGSCSLREVAYVRRHNTCSVMRAADILLKRDAKINSSSNNTTTSTSTTTPRHHSRGVASVAKIPASAAAAEWRTGLAANRKNNYVHVERLIDESYNPWMDELDNGAPVTASGNATNMAADERYPPTFTTWDRRYVPTTTTTNNTSIAATPIATNGHYNDHRSPATQADHIAAASDYSQRVRHQSSDPTPLARTPNDWDYVYDKVRAPATKDSHTYNGREIITSQPQHQHLQPVPPPRRDPNNYALQLNSRRKVANEPNNLRPAYYGGESDMQQDAALRIESGRNFDAYAKVAPSSSSTNYPLLKRMPESTYGNRQHTMVLPSRLDCRMTPLSAAASTYPCHNSNGGAGVAPPLHPPGYSGAPYGSSGVVGTSYNHYSAQPCPVIMSNHVCRAQVAYTDMAPSFLMGGSQFYTYEPNAAIAPTSFPVNASGYGSNVTSRGPPTTGHQQPPQPPPPSQQHSRDLSHEMQTLNLRDYDPVALKAASDRQHHRRSFYDNVNADEPPATSSNSAFANRSSRSNPVATANVATKNLMGDPLNLHLQARKESPLTIYGSSVPKPIARSTSTGCDDDEVDSIIASSTNTARRDYNGAETNSRRSINNSLTSKATPPPSMTSTTGASTNHNGPASHNGTSSRSITTPASSSNLTRSFADEGRVSRSLGSGGGGSGSETVPPRRRGSSSSNCHERSPSVGSRRGGRGVGDASSASNYSSGSSSTTSEASWDCMWCTYTNPGERQVCEMCCRSRSLGAESKALSSGGQECKKCTLVNDKDSRSCSACNESLKNSPTYV